MKERPILFSASMARAILAGEKTQTRRVMKPQPWLIPGTPYITGGWMWTRSGDGDGEGLDWGINAPMDEVGAALAKYCPYGQPGDRLWVRESFRFGSAPNDASGQGIALFGSDASSAIPHPDMEMGRYNWCRRYVPVSAIHMPRWACRLLLEVTGVRVERVQEITEDDARAEGMEVLSVGTATWSNRQSFAVLWDQINGKRAGCAWDNNPWVWVIEFRRVL